MLKLDTSGSVPTLYLYGDVAQRAWYYDPGEVVSAEEVLELLDQVPADKDLAVRLNSPGGDVFEGVAIYNALARREGEVTIHVDALAASIASVIAMAGDQIVIAGNAMLMIHRAWTFAMGNALELAKVVESLRQVDATIVDTYEARVGGKSSRADIEGWLDGETWMGAAEAVARGFATRAEPLKTGGEIVEARVPEGRYKNTPRELLVPREAARKPPRQRPARGAPQPAAEHDRPAGLRYLPAVAARIAAARARNRAA